MIGSYNVAYALAWANAAVGAVCGVLAAAGLTVHPAWLSADVASTAGIVALCCGALATILPRIQKTPAAREQAYLDAAQGILPPDVATKHPLVLADAQAQRERTP